MELIPAIDLLHGRIVRLREGRYEEVTTYHGDPVILAQRYAQAGVTRLHVVDLEGARSGVPSEFETIEKMVKSAWIPVQVGGGIRTKEAAERWWSAGADRVVIGTSAVRSPELIAELAKSEDGAVAVAVDSRDGIVRIEGWTVESGRKLDDFAREMDSLAVEALLFTNISRDGTAQGPDIDGTAKLQSLVKTTVIASGGIGTLEHIEALRNAGVRATVCGRALLSGAVSIEDALRVAQGAT